MRLLAVSVVGLVCACAAATRPLAQWVEAPFPADRDTPAGRRWAYAGNYSRLEWRVWRRGSEVQVERVPPVQRARVADDSVASPAFVPRAEEFVGSSSTAYAAVDDGWLVGFNEGEFGAALYWFSWDGKEHTKVSDHQVVQFFAHGGRHFAVAGLAHLALSEGSVVELSRPGPFEHWRAVELVDLKEAPATVAVRRDGTALITLYDSVVAMGPDGRLSRVFTNAPWSMLYPNSSVLSADETKLYLGMRQYVGVLELASGKLTLLVPSLELINRLTESERRGISLEDR